MSNGGTRRTAAERREEIVTAAIEHFAASGYSAASTDAIARDAGISQPYLFRLFGTKRDLFLACEDRTHERLLATFREAAAGVEPETRMSAMGKAYVETLGDRTFLLFQMQAYAACADPQIQAHVRRRYIELGDEVRRLTGADPAGLWRFFSTGMLLNVVASLDLAAADQGSEWVSRWSEPNTLLSEMNPAGSPIP